MAMKENNYSIVQDAIEKLLNLQETVDKVDLGAIEKLCKRVKNEDDSQSLDNAMSYWDELGDNLQNAIDSLADIEESDY